MRKSYVKPTIYTEEFVPNQRIASCGAIIDINKSYTLKCCSYNSTTGKLEPSCNNSSNHNVTLPSVFMQTANGCGHIITSTTPEEIQSEIDAYMATESSKWTEGYVDVTGDGIPENVWMFNPSGNHIVSFDGWNVYEDPFKS